MTILTLPGLDHSETPRELRDLFTQYAPYQDAELPWMRTECVIDALQATAYLVQAVVFLYRAIDYTGLECPRNTPDGCAVSVAGFVASMSWVASYLSLAASSCGDALNSGALCAADWTALMADFAEVASSGAAVKHDCDFGGRISGLLLHLDRNRRTHHWHWQQFIPPGAGPALLLARKRHVPWRQLGRGASSSRSHDRCTVIAQSLPDLCIWELGRWMKAS